MLDENYTAVQNRMNTSGIFERIFFTLIQLQLPFFWHTPQMFTMSVHNTDFGFSNANIRNVTLEKNVHTYINMSVFIFGIKGLTRRLNVQV